MVTRDQHQALEEVRCRLVAVERLQADQLTSQVVAPADAAWASVVLLGRARLWLDVATEDLWEDAA